MRDSKEVRNKLNTLKDKDEIIKLIKAYIETLD